MFTPHLWQHRPRHHVDVRRRPRSHSICSQPALRLFKTEHIFDAAEPRKAKCAPRATWIPGRILGRKGKWFRPRRMLQQRI